jgi:DNA-binding response OmpR family regulator
MNLDAHLPTSLHRGGITLDLMTYKVVRTDSHAVQLTPNEFRVLYVLMLDANSIVTTDQLLHRVWKSDATLSSWSNVVAVCIWRLRAKIELNQTEPEHILTLFRKGYVFKAE